MIIILISKQAEWQCELLHHCFVMAVLILGVAGDRFLFIPGAPAH